MHQVKRMGATAVGCLCALLVAGGAQAVVGTGGPAGLPQAYQILVSITNSKGVMFKGDRPGQNTIAALSFQYAVVSPRDAATFRATGNRMHKPIRIKKAWGAASPELFQALVTNEVLKSVVIDFVTFAGTGQLVNHHTVKLTNANVASIEEQTEEVVKGQLTETEVVDFVFQKIEIIDNDSKTVVADTVLMAP